MDKVLLGIICSGIILLVIAFWLATPGIKSVYPSSGEETALTRMMHDGASKPLHRPSFH
jgi:hypothetical protein